MNGNISTSPETGNLKKGNHELTINSWVVRLQRQNFIKVRERVNEDEVERVTTEFRNVSLSSCRMRRTRLTVYPL